jgi:hypothetical protein
VKHHKVKNLYRLMPDRPPLPDGLSSTRGGKKKKIPLAEMTEKHLWDRARPAFKRLNSCAARVIREKGNVSPWRTPEGFIRGVPLMMEWDCEFIESDCDFLSRVFEILEQRMS